MESDITGKSQINWQLLWISFSANYDLKQTYHNLHTCYIRVDSGTADIIILAVFVHHNKWASWKNCFHKLHFCYSFFLFSHSAFSSTRDLLYPFDNSKFYICHEKCQKGSMLTLGILNPWGVFVMSAFRPKSQKKHFCADCTAVQYTVYSRSSLN